MTATTLPNIAPWLPVANAKKAVDHYESAFGAKVLYRLEGDGGSLAVAQLSIGGAIFWVQDDPEIRGSGAIRMILSVEDPDSMFAQALAAGAKLVVPMSEAHGWRTGRLTDPFGHDWELSKQITSERRVSLPPETIDP